MTIVRHFNDLKADRKRVVLTKILNIFPEKTLREVTNMSEEELLTTRGVGRITYDYIRTLDEASDDFNVEQLKHMTYRRRLMLGQNSIMKNMRKFGLYVLLLCIGSNAYAFPGHAAIRSYNDNIDSVTGLKTVGTASYYTVKSCQREGTSGVYTANGEEYIESNFTCALRYRKWGGEYRVTNIANNKSVIVRHNDYGPNQKLYNKGRVIDLSPAAFSAIGDLRDGLISVRVERISK